MNDKNLFLKKVTPLFWKFGAKTLTMDEIAREFSVSKKTLYQTYPNKESLLRDVLEYTLDTIIEQIETAKIKFENPIEAILNSHGNMEFLMTESSNVFVLQLQKYYDKVLDEHKTQIYDRLLPVFNKNIERGRELGFYRTDFSHKIYFKFLLQLFFSVEDSPLFDEERSSEEILCINIVDFYLNSILTEKGRENYKKLKNKYEQVV